MIFSNLVFQSFDGESFQTFLEASIHIGTP